ncbi:hypothetical protein [Sulfitobacter sp. S190]|uniref:hypothetical protein n=1 Tax=Sulfitobacter sp. S190 TaxID=2867022 RepID=UPI0021A295A9|nr:hypothetical protein [Sulfitobacter sp. S190]UWR23210.1 hypothetical protein K3756_04235 [Sulfitobacter sp. S190]
MSLVELKRLGSVGQALGMRPKKYDGDGMGGTAEISVYLRAAASIAETSAFELAQDQPTHVVERLLSLSHQLSRVADDIS